MGKPFGFVLNEFMRAKSGSIEGYFEEFATFIVLAPKTLYSCALGMLLIFFTGLYGIFPKCGTPQIIPFFLGHTLTNYSIQER